MIFPLKGGFKNFIDKVHDFYFSPSFPFFVGIMTLIFFINQWALLGLFFFALSASFCFLFFKDVSPIMPLLVMVIMIFNDYSVMNDVLAYVCLSPAIVTFLIRFFVYPPKNIRLNSHFFALLCVSVALFTAGLFVQDNDFLQALISSVTLGPVLIIIYLFFRGYISPKKNLDFKKYFCYTLLSAGLVIAVTILYYHYHAYFLKDDRIAYYNEIGWANINCLATFLCLSIPACYYLITKSKNSIIYLPILLLLYFGVQMTNSDGVFLLIFLATPVMIFFCIFNKFTKKKGSYTIILILCAILMTIVYLVIFDVIKLSFFSTGRKDLFHEAEKWFSESPIFGKGLGRVVFDKSQPGPDKHLRNFNFHSTFYHVLATMGIVGIIAYFIYFVARIFILTKRQTDFNFFMFIAFLLFECYGLVDTAEFNAIPLMTTLTLVIIAVDITNIKADRELPLSAYFLY